MRKVHAAVWGVAMLAALVACSHGSGVTGPQQRPSRVPAHRRTSVPGPFLGPAPSPKETRFEAIQTPSPSASPAAKQAPTLAPAEQRVKVVRLTPDAAPRILDVAMSETTVRPGDRVSGSVVTSSNVASVEARIGGYAVSLVKVGVGRFALAYAVGALPWFVHGDFKMQVIARNPRGDAAIRTISLTVP
ncbi:MAG: hypothetical protein WCB99_01655 [Candidatus Cybelea sp.]